MDNNQENGSVTPVVNTEQPGAQTAQAEQVERPDKFKDDESWKKSYLELEKKLPELSKSAKDAETYREKFNKLTSVLASEQNVSVDEIVKAIDEKFTAKPDTNNEVQILKSQLAELTFTAEYPEAKANLDLIKAYAKDKGLTLTEAYADPAIQRIVDLDKAAKKEKDGTSVIETNKRTVAEKGQYEEAYSKWRKLPQGEAKSKALQELLAIKKR